VADGDRHYRLQRTRACPGLRDLACHAGGPVAG
jgi:hypothetical protein